MKLPENTHVDATEFQNKEDDDVGYITWLQTLKTAFAGFFVGTALFPLTAVIDTIVPDSDWIVTYMAKILLFLPIPVFVVTVLLSYAIRHEIKQFAIKYRRDE
ncbi:hypothetical protein MettiDRAFT_2632 [Methanolobus tindarius DSM 2278]|uniref:Uncharacterized protein n=1 Tax=Methanolobus tindarius DSM 2278 TaxID=1090322 RepID=W9DTM7_METTI|nr:hypothetical protein [Methanolobus tindarius]ETA69138.1 hypothetical protein MettiDRAFT_2632 [Methanolobus tindarius DSM 2278]